GKSLIMQMARIGEGKSMSFMLLAFCLPKEVTIVMVLLVALQEDLHRQCKSCKIDLHVWQS
ncbi:hypothetical protein QBC33DRAFT_463064, partial [Phialemonium atrogriseum]